MLFKLIHFVSIRETGRGVYIDDDGLARFFCHTGWFPVSIVRIACFSLIMLDVIFFFVNTAETVVVRDFDSLWTCSDLVVLPKLLREKFVLV